MQFPGQQDWQMQCGVRVQLRDGTELSANLYLPSQTGRWPVVLTMTPYTAQRHHEQGVYFARNGYAFLSTDVRGRGNSAGEFHPLNEARDGHDVVEWLAAQPFCNGQVAMWGLSYLGRCQWAAASQCPPHLATIVPVAAPYYSVDAPLRNNVATPYTAQWLMSLAGRTLQDRIFADHSFWREKFQQWFEAGLPLSRLDAGLGNRGALFREWIDQPLRNSYWDQFNPTPAQYARVSIPVLTITGAYDGDQLGALEHYRSHLQNAEQGSRAEHYLIIGPWDHACTYMPKAEFCGLKVGPASLVDLLELHLQWYAWVLRDAPKPQLLKKNVAYYVTGAEEWRYADTLEEVTARVQPLYLHSSSNPTDVFHSGTIAPQMTIHAEPDFYIYDPRDVGHAKLEASVDSESLVDQSMLHAMQGKHLVYHSTPFPNAADVSGFFKLRVWLAIDQPDTDFRATVYEVALDGSVVQLSADWCRARYRESLRAEKLIDTTSPLCYEFDRFTFVSRRIREGHRLRLVFGPINSIHWEKNYNTGGVVANESMREARVVTVRLFHDEQHPSALYVPWGVSE